MNKEYNSKKDYRLIIDLVENGSSILDLGCGSGELMKSLSEGKNTDCTGIDRNPEMVSNCIIKKLKVFNLDFNKCLDNFNDNSYDYVIIYNSLQESRFPEKVITESLRIGKKLIVGFPNFGFLSARIQLFFRGKAPVTSSLPDEWYNTRNLRFLTINDFIKYCRKNKIKILHGSFYPDKIYTKLRPNLFSEYVVFVLRM